MSRSVDLRPDQPVAADVAGEVRAIIRAVERLAETIREDAAGQAAEMLRKAGDDARRQVEAAHREAQRVVAAGERRAAHAERVLERSDAVSDDLAAVRRARHALDEALDSLGAAVERISRAETESDTGLNLDGDRPPSANTGAAQGEGFHARASQPAVRDLPRAEEVVRGKTGARLVAAQMALAGSSRAEVAAHLRRTFELPVALHEILDEVFDKRETGVTSIKSDPMAS